jgi:CheY-like chemotaxis protein
MEPPPPIAEMEMPRVVLIVDDQPLILSLTSAMLEDLGCEVFIGRQWCDAFGPTCP